MCQKDERCAICQDLSKELLCPNCKARWDETLPWVQDLTQLEQVWRGINAADIEYATAYVLDDGHVFHNRKVHVDVHTIERQWNLTEDQEIIHQVDLWAAMGGLTVYEQHALRMLEIGADGRQATLTISDMEHHPMTISAYWRRVEAIERKIRHAIKTGELELTPIEDDIPH
jgi:hypothetical protein